jgi:Glu-tRNA(Gln) amidotransferase subunit E-like FAD-binding protein
MIGFIVSTAIETTLSIGWTVSIWTIDKTIKMGKWLIFGSTRTGYVNTEVLLKRLEEQQKRIEILEGNQP